MTTIEIAHVYPASAESVAAVLSSPVGDDGHSEAVWMRLSNGDLILGTFPTGFGYEDTENVEQIDRAAAYRDGTLSTVTVPVNGEL